MSVKPIKPVLIMCLFFGSLFLCILGCSNTISHIVEKALATDPNGIPVKTLKIMMDVKQHEELFTQLQKFSGKHSLKFGLSLFDADKISFLAVIYGDGFHITVVNTTNSPDKIRISFYNEASTPTPQKAIEELFSDLKSFLGEVSSVMITEEK